MILNYLKLGFRVLLRNKLYTFISLFGISFTLMVLMLLTTYMQSNYGKSQPLSNRDKILVVDQLELTRWQQKKETNIQKGEDGTMDTIVTSVPIVGESESQSTSSIGYDFYEKYLIDLPSAELSTIYYSNAALDVFLNSKKKTLTTCYSDENYWEIFDFQFVEGKPYSSSDIEGQKAEAVITQSVAKELFGKLPTYVGQTFKHKDKQIRICGVIKDINSSFRKTKQDIFLPYTLCSKTDLNSFSFFGSMTTTYLAKSKDHLEQLKNELNQVESRVDMGDSEGFDQIRIFRYSILEYIAQQVVRKPKNNFKILSSIIGIGVFLFILIPVLNLINLNITRIMERSAEIGVRKAFGATRINLMYQLILENILLTLIGGILGIILTYLAIYIFKTLKVFTATSLTISISTFVIFLVITLFFGLLSGLIPAWRMSKVNIAQSLKSNTL